MINSRCPRPIGIMPSTALRPVWSGWFTFWRWITPRALRSIGRNLVGVDRSAAVGRLAERVEHASEHLFADRHRCHAAGALDRVALLDLMAFAEEDATHVVLFEVQHHAEHAVREFHEFAHERLGEAVDARNTVAHLQHRPDIVDVGLFFEIPPAVSAG